MLAGSTGLEPAASGVTGRRSNQLNYDPKNSFDGDVAMRLRTFLSQRPAWWAVQDSNL